MKTLICYFFFRNIFRAAEQLSMNIRDHSRRKTMPFPTSRFCSTECRMLTWARMSTLMKAGRFAKFTSSREHRKNWPSSCRRQSTPRRSFTSEATPQCGQVDCPMELTRNLHQKFVTQATLRSSSPSFATKTFSTLNSRSRAKQRSGLTVMRVKASA